MIDPSSFVTWLQAAGHFGTFLVAVAVRMAAGHANVLSVGR